MLGNQTQCLMVVAWFFLMIIFIASGQDGGITLNFRNLRIDVHTKYFGNHGYIEVNYGTLISSLR